MSKRDIIDSRGARVEACTGRQHGLTLSLFLSLPPPPSSVSFCKPVCSMSDSDILTRILTRIQTCQGVGDRVIGRLTTDIQVSPSLSESFRVFSESLRVACLLHGKSWIEAAAMEERLAGGDPCEGGV